MKKRSTSDAAASDSTLNPPTCQPRQELSPQHPSPSDHASQQFSPRQLCINWYRPLSASMPAQLSRASQLACPTGSVGRSSEVGQTASRKYLPAVIETFVHIRGFI